MVGAGPTIAGTWSSTSDLNPQSRARRAHTTSTNPPGIVHQKFTEP